MHSIRSTITAIGVAALALPAAAAAKPHTDHPAHGHGHAQAPHRVMYVFRGTWSGGSVQVTGGNRHVRRADLVGQSVAFDLDSARIVVRDVNADGARDLSDVSDGDRVVVQARLPKGDPGDGPFAARKLVDRARGDDSSDDSSEASEPEQD